MSKYSDMFMEIAEITAQQSNCVKYKVGAVVVKDNRVILQGYNGTISGFTNCSDKFDHNILNNPVSRAVHSKWADSFEVHAEMNVIAYAARKGISIEGTTLYCTHEPCNNCLKHLIQSGVKNVIYKNDFTDNANLEDRKQLLLFIELFKFESDGL